MSCPRCQEGSILLGEPTGSIEPGLLGNSYVSPSPSTSDPGETPSPTKKAVLVFTDAFGLGIPNPKLIADELANHLHCDVWVPDYFLGLPLIPADAMTVGDRAGVRPTLWQWIKFTVTVVIPNIGSFWSNRSSRIDSRLEEFIVKLKEQKNYEKIGAIGYCFGGATAIRLAKRPDLLNTVVICHPAPFNFEDITNIQIPCSWACAEDDMWFSDSLRARSEAELESRKGKDNFVEYEFRVYKGTAHGFASRPDLGTPEVKTAFAGALVQTVDWFKKML